MPDAVSLTELVSVLGGIAATCVVPFALARRRSADNQAATAVRNWAELNEALQAEIRRVTRELERQRTDYQSQLNDLRGDYQSQLDGARRRITELEAEVAALQRALRGAGP